MPFFSSLSPGVDDLCNRVRNSRAGGSPHQAQQQRPSPSWSHAGYHPAASPNAHAPYGPSAAPQPFSPPPQNPGWMASPPPPPPPLVPGRANYGLQNVKWASTSNMPQLRPQPGPNPQSSVSLPCNLRGNAISMTSLRDAANGNGGGYLQQGTALFNAVSQKFEDVISCIDEELFSGKETDLVLYEPPYHPATSAPEQAARALLNAPSGSGTLDTSASSSNHFSKVWLYSNSRLPPYLPPLKLYTSTFPLLCLAAQYSERVYQTPSGRTEKADRISSDFRRGTKPMLLKSLPRDDMNTIVFAIRGSSSIMDWSVNYRTEPASPQGFLDDAGNLCHSGFLKVAKSTAPLVAERLRALLQENPGRCQASLLICGHSAGGAVAQLLYAHMMSQDSSVRSESGLKDLTSFFKRVHCVTFGAPPVSLLPLDKPRRRDRSEKKSLFFAFVNEGDPVVRADKAVVASLLKLYASPAPNVPPVATAGARGGKLRDVKSSTALAAAALGMKPKSKAEAKSLRVKGSRSNLPPQSVLPSWNIPPGTLSLGGRLVLLRERGRGRSIEEDIDAFTVTDEMLRSVVYGDPVRHMMKLYARRVEVLATRAVTGR